MGEAAEMPERRVVGAREHYERLIDEGNDPFRDPPFLQAYMSMWDGPPFYQALGDVRGKDILEVGVGTGRVARQLLERGCARLTGIDFSPKTLARARENLAPWPNVELVEADAQELRYQEAFDVAYSVLTFLHIPDKPLALAGMVAALRPEGRLVLSVAHEGDWLEFNDRRIALHVAPPEAYRDWLLELGCVVGPPTDRFAPDGERIATILRARKAA